MALASASLARRWTTADGLARRFEALTGGGYAMPQARGQGDDPEVSLPPPPPWTGRAALTTGQPLVDVASPNVSPAVAARPTTRAVANG